MFLGGGRANFKTHANFPMHCNACKNMFECNVLAAEIKCPSCDEAETVIPYSDASLCKSGTTRIFDWRSTAEKQTFLTDGSYVCPSCQQQTLKFAHVGYFD
jgi:Zn finger protein HypA/HybF involved in hydrogenase expression